MTASFDPSRDCELFDYVQTSAWIGLVEYLMGQDWAIARFTADTGITPPRRRSGIEALIDKATGYDGNMEFIRAFLPWVTSEHWGGEDELTPGISDIIARCRDSDGPRMAETNEDSARGEAGPARAEGIAQGQQP